MVPAGDAVPTLTVRKDRRRRRIGARPRPACHLRLRHRTGPPALSRPKVRDRSAPRDN